MRITHNQLRRLIRETLEEMEPMMSAPPPPTTMPSGAGPGPDGVHLLYLSLRANLPEFYLDDERLEPPPVDMDAMEDSPGLLQRDLLAWAQENGVTHIKDDDLVEQGLTEDDKIFSLREYEAFLDEHSM